jgi:uncharacterized membrane protein YccF (DUF307 family)
VESRQVPILIRFVYFVCFGLWAGGLAAAAAWICCVTVIGLPLGIFILLRLPLVMTLQLSEEQIVLAGRGYVLMPASESPPLLLRALWFLVFGWWLAGIWISVAFALGSTIILSPFAFWMFNRVPAVLTLEGV